LIVSQIPKQNRFNVKRILICLEKSGRGVLSVALACGVAGIVVGSLSFTGLGIRLSSMIVALAQGNLIATMVLTMIVTLILSMGLPTTGAYVIAASVCAPAMIQLGVMPIAAHLFVFYFAIINAITPPVALAAYAAAGISEEDPFKIGIEAFKLGIVAFIVPYMFVYGNELLLIGPGFSVIRSLITAIIGIVCLVIAVKGWFMGKITPLPRLLMFIASLGLIETSIKTDIMAVVLALIAYLIERRIRNSRTISSLNE
jgi:TRAP-type uncharacterized transport system fused permease subunit